MVKQSPETPHYKTLRSDRSMAQDINHMNIQVNTGDNARNSSGGGQDGQSGRFPGQGRAARGTPDE
ncbi:MAG: hypothetical protein K2O93_02845, partial [Oscillospiraceae bacterium]|nr:hypothetical protein [Oscillospiraceae bacterium]